MPSLTQRRAMAAAVGRMHQETSTVLYPVPSEVPPHIPRLGPWWQAGYSRIPQDKKRRFFKTFNVDCASYSDLNEGYSYVVLELFEQLAYTSVVNTKLWDMLIEIASRLSEMPGYQAAIPESYGLRPQQDEHVQAYVHGNIAAREEARSWLKLLDLLRAADDHQARSTLVDALANKTSR
ncbi:MAG: hypothetical protein KIT09_00410 [Bryobacteraceae bacterium]|nr:hypothetical protein [Bryobacteraceae bacterium]